MRKLRKILITAGPTREHLDPVRFITNLSTGEMGYALAREAKKKGYWVTLVSGPTCLKSPRGVKFHPVTSAGEMKSVCEKLFPNHDGLIMTAAVCDFTPARQSRHKIPSAAGLTLKLKRTPDILAALSRQKGKRVVIGFCLETRDLIRRAVSKLRTKRLNGIVANCYDTKQHIPFGKRKIEVVLADSRGGTQKLGRLSKKRLAGRILAWMVRLAESV